MRMDIQNAGYITYVHDGVLKPKVVYLCRDGLGKRYRVGDGNFKPRFYVPRIERHTSSDRDKALDGEYVSEVFVDVPATTIDMRKLFTKTYLADVDFWKVHAVEHGFYVGLDVSQYHVVPAEPLGVHPKLGYADIEVTSPPEIVPKPEDPKYPIVTIQISNNYDDVTWVGIVTQHEGPYHRFDTERELLRAFALHTMEAEYDIISGWYFNNYDLPYIHSRMLKLGLSFSAFSPLGWYRWIKANDKKGTMFRGKRPVDQFRVAGMSFCDLMDMYMKKYGSETLAERGLKPIVARHVNYKYDDLGDRIQESLERLERGDLALAQYCYNEIYAMKELDRVTKLHDGLMRIRKKAGCSYEEALKNSIVYDTSVLRTAKEWGVVLPTKIYRNVKKDKLKGGVVIDPPTGVQENIGVYDIASTYPSIIMAANISPETICDDGDIVIRADDTGKEYRFRSKPKGIIPTVVGEWVDERMKLKRQLAQLQVGTPEYDDLDAEQSTFRFLVNSIYGAMDYQNFRLYNPRCSSAITAVARNIITRIARKHGATYGDTDSVFLPIGTVARGLEIHKVITSDIGDYISSMGFVGDIEIDFQKFYRYIFFKKDVKKRYAGRLVWNKGQDCDIIKVVGFEAKRSDSAEITRITQKQFISLLLKIGPKTAMDYLSQIKEDFRSLSPQMIAIPKGLSKEMDEYETTSPWIRGVVYSQYWFDYHHRQDKKAKLLYLRDGRELIVDEELPDEVLPSMIDYNMHFEKCIRMKMEGMVQAIGYDWGYIDNKTIQPKLM